MTSSFNRTAHDLSAAFDTFRLRGLQITGDQLRAFSAGLDLED